MSQPQSAPPAANADGARTIQRRALGAALAGILIAVVWVTVRGNWAESAERNPTRAEEAPVVQLLRTPAGRLVVRAAAVVAAPADATWKTVVDYEHFQQIFATRWWHYAEVQAGPEQDGVRHLTGKVDTVAGIWPVDIDIRHHADAGEFRAEWDGTVSESEINRGSWRVTPLGEQACLLVLQVEVQVPRVPNALVNNVMLSQLHTALAAVREHLQRPR